MKLNSKHLFVDKDVASVAIECNGFQALFNQGHDGSGEVYVVEWTEWTALEASLKIRSEVAGCIVVSDTARVMSHDNITSQELESELYDWIELDQGRYMLINTNEHTTYIVRY